MAESSSRVAAQLDPPEAHDGNAALPPAADPPLDLATEDLPTEGTRGRRHRRLWILIVPVVLAALGVGGWFALHSRLFSARAVTVQGAVHESKAEVIGAARLRNDPPLMDIDPGRIAARVERLPWVATAQVSRGWPDGVLIRVIERKPVAVIGYAVRGLPGRGWTSRWAEVDRTGRVLADLRSPPSGLPGLSVRVVPGAPGSRVRRSLLPGLTVAATLPDAFRQQVTGIGVTRGQVSLTMTTPITVRLGSAAHLEAKYEDVAAMLARASLAAGDVIDVSVPDSPVVVGG